MLAKGFVGPVHRPIFGVLMSIPTTNSSSPQLSLCRAAICTGTTHFLRHSLGIVILLVIVASLFYLSAGRLGSSLKLLIQEKVNQTLAGSGLQVDFDDIQFVEGQGIRIDNAKFLLDGSAPELATADVETAATDPLRFVPAIASLDRSTIGQTNGRIATPWVKLDSVNAYLLDSQSLAANRPWVESPSQRRQRAQRPSISNNVEAMPSKESLKTIASFEKIWIRGQWSPVDFLSPDFHPTAIEMVGADLRLTLDRNGQLLWPTIRLPQPQFATPGKIRLIDAKVTVQSFDGQQQYVCDGINVDFLQIQSPNTQTLQAKAAQNPALQSNQLESPQSEPRVVEHKGTIDCDWNFQGTGQPFGLEPISFSGSWINHQYQVLAQWVPIHLHRGIWQKFDGLIPAAMKPIHGVSGWLAVDKVQIVGQPASSCGLQPEFSIEGRLQQVTIEDVRLPQPVLNLSAVFKLNNQGAVVQNITGVLADGSFHASVTKSGWTSPASKLHLVGKNLPFNRRWVGLLSEKLQTSWQKFQPEGRFDCDLDFACDQQWQLDRRGIIDAKDMSFLYTDFPIPMAGIAGRIDLQNNDCRFDLITNDQRYPATMVGWVNDMGQNWTGRIDLKSTQFHPINESLYQGLQRKPNVIKVLRKMNPAGMMAANGFIQRDVPQSKSDVKFNVAFHAGEVTHDLFPYRVFGISGNMLFDNGYIVVQELEGVSSTGNIKASAEFSPDRPWWVKIVGQAVELNQELYQALQPGQQDVWDHLHPKGVLDEIILDIYGGSNEGLKFVVSGSQQPSTTSDPSDLSILSESFPYQLSQLSGRFQYQDNQVTLTGVRGNHGEVSVACDGSGITSDDGWQVTIYNLLTGQIPIDRDIKAALPETVRNAAQQLRLTGSVGVQGSVTISSSRLPLPAAASPIVQNNVTILDPQYQNQSQANSSGIQGRMAPIGSIGPIASPRSLANPLLAGGNVNAGNNVFRFQDSTRASPRGVGIGTGPSSGTISNNDSLSLKLDSSTISGSNATASGKQNWTSSPMANSAANLVWDLRLDMEVASLEIGLPAKNVHGMVRLVGESGPDSAYCYGEMHVDSAMVEGLQVTSMRGPIWMNEREILFGTQAKPPDTITANTVASVTMETLGGRVTMDGRVLLRDDLPFQMQATVNHLDLKKMAAHFAPETRDIEGQGFASLSLNGSSAGRHTLNGRGIVRIKDAKLYEVPVFLQLLKILKVGTPDKTAFDAGKIDFDILGEDVALNRIELNGDAISLIGNGRATLNQEVDMDFYTVLGRNQFYLPVISDLLHVGSQQLLWISVEGTLANPKTTHESLRALNEAVRLLLDDMEAAAKHFP